MKANRKTIWNNDDRAQVGIGTMIVFIATILVAATAAAVLVDTSGKLQERSSSTGNEATKQVASNLVVQRVDGGRGEGANDNIEWINITVALAPGASSIDLEQLKIQIVNGDDIKTFDYSAAADANSDIFLVDFDRDTDTSANVMTTGDLVDLQVELDDRSFAIEERTNVVATLMPEVGAHIDASFTTPETFGSATYLVFR